MNRRNFLGAAAASVFAPQFGRWFARSSGILLREQAPLALEGVVAGNIFAPELSSFFQMLRPGERLQITQNIPGQPQQVRDVRITDVRSDSIGIIGVVTPEMAALVRSKNAGVLSMGYTVHGPALRSAMDSGTLGIPIPPIEHTTEILIGDRTVKVSKSPFFTRQIGQ